MFNKIPNNQEAVTLVQPYQVAIDRGVRFLSGVSSANLAAGASINLLLKPVGTHKLKIAVNSFATGEYVVNLYKNPTITANGTAVTPINKNLSSNNVLSDLVYSGSTLSNNGTAINYPVYVGSVSVGNSTSGGSALLSDEYMVKTDNILAVLTNNSSSAIKATLDMIISSEEFE